MERLYFTAEVSPVPLSTSLCGEPGASSVKVRRAVRLPVAPGVESNPQHATAVGLQLGSVESTLVQDLLRLKSAKPRAADSWIEARKVTGLVPELRMDTKSLGAPSLVPRARYDALHHKGAGIHGRRRRERDGFAGRGDATSGLRASVLFPQRSKPRGYRQPLRTPVA